MHFADHLIQTREITDPDTGRLKEIRTLAFDVDELNGQPVVSSYSITSEKHAMDFGPYLEGKRYRDYYFEVTQTGDRYSRVYILKVAPKKK
jgi:hypothetical protein